VKDDRLYLIHIRECIERIERYTAGGREEFLVSTLVQDAAVRNLQILAESTKRLSRTVREAHPEVDWRAIDGLRNVLVHDYLGVDVERVWQIVERDLPALKQKVTVILSGQP
jgi:uncharacterized protein with HEPN domain